MRSASRVVSPMAITLRPRYVTHLASPLSRQPMSIFASPLYRRHVHIPAQEDTKHKDENSASTDDQGRDPPEDGKLVRKITLAGGAVVVLMIGANDPNYLAISAFFLGCAIFSP